MNKSIMLVSRGKLVDVNFKTNNKLENKSFKKTAKKTLNNFDSMSTEFLDEKY